MILKLKRYGLYAVCAVLFCVFVFFLLFLTGIFRKNDNVFAGGRIHKLPSPPIDVPAVMMTERMAQSERFQRPAKAAALPNPYCFEDFSDGEMPVFNDSEQVIYAYYAVLEQASNMAGFTGGCGTVGYDTEPYSYAYQLLADETKVVVTPKTFENSFKGIGHIAFLKLYPAYESLGTPMLERYYMVELEMIRGGPSGKAAPPDSTHFDYYYGLITVINEGGSGWKINETHYVSEDFLCAPYHRWDYDATSVVSTVFKDNMRLTENVTDVKRGNDKTTIYASGYGNEYRFDFIRLTNGHDILLHQYQKKSEKWEEANLLPPEWNYIMLDVNNFKD